MGAFANSQQWFKDADPVAVRERSMAAQLDRFRDAGLRVVMPLVVTSSNVAFYPSKVVPVTAHGDWDPWQR